MNTSIAQHTLGPVHRTYVTLGHVAMHCNPLNQIVGGHSPLAPIIPMLVPPLMLSEGHYVIGCSHCLPQTPTTKSLRQIPLHCISVSLLQFHV